MARGPVFVSAVVLYSLAYDAADVMDNDNLATALEAQIQISIVNRPDSPGKAMGHYP